MKKLLIASLLLASCTAFAQTISVKKIGVTYSFDQQFFPDHVNIQEFYGYTVLEKSGSNFTAGVTTELALLKRLSLVTGLSYSNRDYTGYLGCATCYYENADWVENSLPRGRETIRQRYIDVPVTARFYFVDKQLSFYGDAGFTGNFLVENNTKNFPYDANEVKSNNFILSGQVGVGVSYTFIKFIEVSITTVYRNSLTTYIATDDMQLRSLGIVGGVSYKFGRPE